MYILHTIEKLIRDNIIDTARAKGDIMSYRIVSSVEEMVGFLCKKLDEELSEYKTATTHQEKTEEAGDVLEVLDTLIELHPTRELHIHMKQYFIQQGVSDLLNIGKILDGQLKKKSEKGGFKKGIIWIY